MSIRVLLRDYPSRAIALVTKSHALIFRHSPTTNDAVNNGSLPSIQSSYSRPSLDSQSTPRCMVEFVALSSVDLGDYRTLSPRPVHGTLGLMTINNDIFICIVTGSSKVAAVRPGETVERIYAVEFYCLSSSNYDSVIINDDLNPYGIESSRDDDLAYGQSLSRRDSPFEHPAAELQKLLSNGSFYYSTDFDLTNRLQDRATDTSGFDIDNLDESFLWNGYMIRPLVKFRSELLDHERDELDASRILTSAIRGFVLTITIPMSSSPIRNSTTGLPSSLTLISRLSCQRAGTRFNSRGIDDDGNVANFVETETIFSSPAGICFSYAQVRGSVPVFWEQAPGLIPGQQKTTITRSKEGTQPAFDKHFEDLEQSYGSVHVVNLLSEKPQELELTALYRYGVKHSSLNRHSKDHQLLKETDFDFHAETKGPSGFEAASTIRHYIEESADSFAYYLLEDVDEGTVEIGEDGEKLQRRSVVVLQQDGVFRTNCLDCLDRTNLVQTIISQMAVESFLTHRGERAGPDFWMRHSSLWADNGDALSRIYAGTGALKSSFTRHGKMSLAGAFADARKSATRLYINNFADKGRQNTIDVLLGRLMGQAPVVLYDPINDYVNAEMNKRSAEYSSSEPINIWVGTFNVNGRTEGIDKDLSEWLFPNGDFKTQPELIVVAFQEIVNLSPQQIMNSDPNVKHAWEKAVKAQLNIHAREVGDDKYVLLRSGQLVGAALCIFVKHSILHNIKNVEGSMKKTGMSGMAGNKGAVAIRMQYANTQICFVTAHLAAGFANYDERNKDYHTINHGLKFQRNRGIDDHDTVIWLGDFNYRIGMGSEKVKALIKQGDLQTLYENDQLNIQMVAGLAFPHYSEARITFNPTYKFDVGTDEYDTSEKGRIPAWTDRILRKGSNIRQTAYYCAPLKFSDHRPVYGTFQCTISIVDEKIRDKLSREIFERRRADVGDAVVQGEDTDDEDLIGYDSIEPGLPPASSDRRKWWLENGQPARSNISPPEKGAIPNPARPSNPWASTEEPGWVTVHREPNRTNSFQSSRSSVPEPPPARGTTRKALPPPYSTTAPKSSPSTSSLPKHDLSNSNNREISPAPRNLSPTSTHSITRKAPPPVAKKPLHLHGAPASPTIARSHTAKLPVRSMFGVTTEFPPPPRRATGIAEKAGSEPPPRPQPRRGADVKSAPPKMPPRPVDLLDGDAEGLSGWEVLKPN